MGDAKQKSPPHPTPVPKSTLTSFLFPSVTYCVWSSQGVDVTITLHCTGSDFGGFSYRDRDENCNPPFLEKKSTHKRKRLGLPAEGTPRFNLPMQIPRVRLSEIYVLPSLLRQTQSTPNGLGIVFFVATPC